MKKLFLFLAFVAFALTSCNNDDDNAPALSSNYLNGTWIETDPTPGHYSLTFNGSTARLDRADGSSDTYTYTVSGNELRLTAQGSETYSQHEAETVNSKTMKLSNMYIGDAAANSIPVITTFKKAEVTNQ